MNNLVEVQRFYDGKKPSVVIVYKNITRHMYFVCVIPGRFPYWSDWAIRYDDSHKAAQIVAAEGVKLYEQEAKGMFIGCAMWDRQYRR